MANELQMRYFVCAPMSSDDAHALASRAAMLAYAHDIAGINPDLASSIQQWVEHLDLEDNREHK